MNTKQRNRGNDQGQLIKVLMATCLALGTLGVGHLSFAEEWQYLPKISEKYYTKIIPGILEELDSNLDDESDPSNQFRYGDKTEDYDVSEADLERRDEARVLNKYGDIMRSRLLLKRYIEIMKASGRDNATYRETKKFKNSPEYKSRNDQFYPMMDAVTAFPSKKAEGVDTIEELLQATKDLQAPRHNGRGYNAYQVLLSRNGCADPNNLVRAAVIWSKSKEQNVQLNLDTTIRNVDGYIRNLDQTLNYTKAHNASNTEQIAWLENAITVCKGFRGIVSNQPESALAALGGKSQGKQSLKEFLHYSKALNRTYLDLPNFEELKAGVYLLLNNRCAYSKAMNCYSGNSGEMMIFHKPFRALE